MGRQGGDSTIVGSSSSIALLQERFRQLQRVREKREEREERELLNLFSEANERINSPTMSYESSKLPFRPDKFFPLRPPLHDALALGLNLQSSSRHTSFKGNKTTKNFTNLWPGDSAASSVRTSKNHFDSSDVDTSLHL